ncbi:hypothetical protein M408DRAFT_22362 [Serendipita vermifera MAFF 305830]|uniref:Uncharacterized protein n=1 Tax=Serendipita vermifera MAFF 305830 TaxID=933852 RepID=A0A0C3BEL4_SERVB|nr:hypothetical protein M408DRAFT_22362 [Serendipita vermifera MAFF 305830]
MSVVKNNHRIELGKLLSELTSDTQLASWVPSVGDSFEDIPPPPNNGRLAVPFKLSRRGVRLHKERGERTNKKKSGKTRKVPKKSPPLWQTAHPLGPRDPLPSFDDLKRYITQLSSALKTNLGVRMSHESSTRPDYRKSKERLRLVMKLISSLSFIFYSPPWAEVVAGYLANMENTEKWIRHFKDYCSLFYRIVDFARICVMDESQDLDQDDGRIGLCERLANILHPERLLGHLTPQCNKLAIDHLGAINLLEEAPIHEEDPLYELHFDVENVE